MQFDYHCSTKNLSASQPNQMMRQRMAASANNFDLVYADEHLVQKSQTNDEIS
jgi:hypothetical protein